MTNRTSRLAPSPTGALHLGNVRTFLVNWAIARNAGWRLLMRIEDLDSPRVRPGAEARLLDLLAWLGLDHDGPSMRQSDDLDPYRAAMRAIVARGLAFTCTLSRREIEGAESAPHADDHELRYPPSLRPAVPAAGFDGADGANYRLIVPDAPVAVDDRIAGAVTFRPSEEIGDFVLWTKRGVPAYQLAVVVDDLRQGVTDVVRGDDLLPSAARQTLVHRALGHDPPRWWHLPLVLGPDGRRLAKRHGDTRVATYRECGVAPERIVGLLAAWSGATPDRRPMSTDAFREAFDVRTLPRGPITFTEDDHAWLCAAS